MKNGKKWFTFICSGELIDLIIDIRERIIGRVDRNIIEIIRIY